MLVVTIAVVLLALVGHAAIWIGINNRWHATGLSRGLVKTVSLAFYAALVGLPPLVAWRIAAATESSWQVRQWLTHPSAAAAYTVFCAAYACVHALIWLRDRRRLSGHPPGVRPTADRIVDVARELPALPTSHPRTRFFCLVPFNQIWQLHVSQFELELPGLPPELEGLSLVHLSDFHFSRRIDRPYFDEVVRLTNELSADVIALTGDICDRRDRIGWIPETVARLEARLGRFFILGNHDLRTRDVARLRSAMGEAGFVDLAGRWQRVGDKPLVVAGNERPWFKTEPAEIDALPHDAFRLLLAHTPDQLRWASRHGFDLMLAGHTHGGQVRFPVIGPIVCPSLHGTKYACGFFHAPPTLMHVSRGTASLFPYRLNCRPEITKLVLRRAPQGG
ncbi:MAG: metallophosphoesterase [Planctomycetota bacterium]|nr:MAG: metallophosphoesterase [Planctomycetota bacterium]